MKTFSIILSFVLAGITVLPAVWVYAVIADALLHAPAPMLVLALPCLVMVTMLVGSILIPFMSWLGHFINTSNDKH